MIPMDRIAVLNTRNRDQDQFRENVRSIADVGLLKPIVVNERTVQGKPSYELVCGEGRFLAYRKLGRTEIPAEVLRCDRKTALLYSLTASIRDCADRASGGCSSTSGRSPREGGGSTSGATMIWRRGRSLTTAG
jgi:ParB family chromosome partitioning protein